ADGRARLVTGGIPFVSVTEPSDTGSTFGRVLLKLLAVFAEWERDAIRDRCYEGKTRAAANGTWIGGRKPFGYDVVEKLLVVNEANAEIVREIFDQYVNSGWGMQKI